MFIIFALSILLYFLPTIIGRNKRNVGAILTLNLLLGWTVVGWVVALEWAMTVETPQQVVLATTAVTAFCTACGNALSGNTRFCSRCGRSI